MKNIGWPLIVSMFCLLLAGVSVSALQPYQSVVALEGLQVDTVLYSSMVLASSAVSIVVALQIGYISDLIGNRRTLVTGTALAGVVGYFVVFAYPSTLSFGLCVVLITPVTSALSQQIYALLHQDGGVDRGFVTSVGRAIFAMSWVITAPVAVLLVSLYGDIYIIFALSSIACLFIAMTYGFSALNGRFGARRNQQTESERRPLPNIVWKHHALPIISCSLFRAALRLNALALGPLALSVGGAIGSIGFVTAVCALLEIPFIVLWGWMTKHFRKKTLLSCGAAISACYFALASVTASVTMLYIITPLAAIGGAAIFSVSISYFQDRAPDRVGFSTSLSSATSFIGSLIASVIFAFSYDQFGAEGTFLIGALLMIAGSLTVLRT